MSGNRFILTVVGKDHPGIVAGIASTLYEYECNIQELNQTVLSDEFAMILLLQPTREIDVHDLDRSLKEKCEKLEVTFTLREATAVPTSLPSPQAFEKSLSKRVPGASAPGKDKVIITVIGADRIGIVAGVTGVLADMNINIVELTASPHVIHDASQYAMVARVEVGDDVDMLALKTALEDCARRLSVDIDVQNQEIFNAMHKI